MLILVGVVIGIPIGVLISFIVADLIVKKKIKEESKRTSIRGKNGFSVELLPCPHCGSNNLELLNGANDSFSIKCNNCKTQTAYFASAVDMISIWNARVENRF